MRVRVLVVAGVVVAAGSGCGGEDGSGRSAKEVADALADVADGEVIEMTEDTDPNDLLGRPNGYEAAVVIKDPRLDEPCDDLGVDCGVTIEEWGDADDAEDRSEYIQGLLEEVSMFGSEYHYFDGPLLVRVTGELTPSEAEEYEAALDG
ncbi:MAG TPA: hypothetical protein VD859_06535 [Nocardioides sp.]|nr:hypothetical protein [Nocardioides sp.]